MPALAASRSGSHPHAQACHRSSNVFLRMVPQLGQIWDVLDGSTKITVRPAHAALTLTISVNVVLTQKSDSSAFPVLSNKEQVARADLLSQRTPPQCVRDDFLRKTSSNALLHWFLGESTEWLSTGNAEEPADEPKCGSPALLKRHAAQPHHSRWKRRLKSSLLLKMTSSWREGDQRYTVVLATWSIRP